MGTATPSYDTDFFAWTQEQAAALRRVAAMRINLPEVDLDHLAEEIEDMGNDTLAKIEGLIAQIVTHLLKLEHSPNSSARNHWRGEITALRTTVHRRARRSPTALGRVDLDEPTRDAVAILRKRYPDRDWIADLPTNRPYTLDQILDLDFFPLNRYGLAE